LYSLIYLISPAHVGLDLWYARCTDFIVWPRHPNFDANLSTVLRHTLKEKAQFPPKDLFVRGRVALPFKVASSSQANQGGIMRLTRSSSDYNRATWPIYVASLPTGNSGGRCPHHSPLLNMGSTLIPNDKSSLGGIGFMVSLMHQLHKFGLGT
jgi:hypothetical protein